MLQVYPGALVEERLLEASHFDSQEEQAAKLDRRAESQAAG